VSALSITGDDVCEQRERRYRCGFVCGWRLRRFGVLRTLRYHEVDEVKAQCPRGNIGRATPALGKQLANAQGLRAISSAYTSTNCLTAVLEVLELGSFAYATALLSCNGDVDVNQMALALAVARWPKALL